MCHGFCLAFWGLYEAALLASEASPPSFLNTVLYICTGTATYRINNMRWIALIEPLTAFLYYYFVSSFSCLCLPFLPPSLINPRLREGYCSLSVCLSVCVCVCVRPSTVFLGNRGNSERETWTYYRVGGMHGKLRFWNGEDRGKLVKRTAAEVSVRQIEIGDDRCT